MQVDLSVSRIAVRVTQDSYVGRDAYTHRREVAINQRLQASGSQRHVGAIVDRLAEQFTSAPADCPLWRWHKLEIVASKTTQIAFDRAIHQPSCAEVVLLF